MHQSGSPEVDFEPIDTLRTDCGESPYWDDRSERLVCVDIVARRVHRLSLSGGATERWTMADFPTAIALRSSGGAILAQASGVFHFDFGTGETQFLCSPDPTPGNRLNEGKCDPAGRFWVGSMQTNLNPDGSRREMDRHSGALFRVDANGSVSRHSEHDFGVSNTMAWSPDRRTFYFGDSLRNVIFAYDYDHDIGAVRNRRVLLEGYPHGVPDGSCIDTDGCLWNARFGGGRVIRITPNGTVDTEFAVPATNPTCCTFGGSDLRTLIVTSARFTLSEAQLNANPLEGALFAARVKQSGPPDKAFAG